MTTHKNKVFWLIVAIAVVLLGVYLGGFWQSDDATPPTPTESPQVDPTGSPVVVPTLTPIASSIPIPTGDGKVNFVDEDVPWHLLLDDASCELQGEIKFLNHNTYDNQDALFIYNGIDNPGRNIAWKITPEDDITIGPNLFGKNPLPKGESLLSITLPDDPKHKAYELIAKIQYGRLVNESGNFVAIGGDVQVFEKQCGGKTTIVLP
jgi:hypothetical protein